MVGRPPPPPAALPHPDLSTLLHLLVEQSREHAVMFLDPQGRIVWWGPGAQKIFGWSAEEIVGEPADRIFVPEDVAKGLPRHEIEVAAADGAAEDDRWQQRRDGSRFWAVGAMVSLRQDGRLVGFAKILRNRTDLREQVETLRNHAAALDQASRRKDQFLSTLSHELRNPLAPLTHALHILRASVPANGDVDFALRVIERQAELLRRLVDDLLDFSRLGAGKVRLEREAIVLDEVLRRAVDDTRTLFARRRQRVELLLPAAGTRVSGDAGRLHQVFVNLLDNAAKYTPPGGRVWVKASTEGDEAVVKVEDNGMGIPHDMQPRIFELFTQVEAARSLAQGGLGIGLALVKDLVALHGGSVQVRSDGEGRGSEFTVRLPLAG